MRKQGVLVRIKSMFERDKVGELLVLKGLITPQELRTALSLQKQSPMPLGQVLIEQAMISRRQLNRILRVQNTLRLSGTTFIFMISFLSLSERKARAETLDSTPPAVVLTSAATHYEALVNYPALYGMSEKRSSNLQPFTKWTSLFSRFENQLKKGGSAGLVRDWEQKLSRVSRDSLKHMAEDINLQLNKVRYISDKNNWGTSDYWATPIEFIQRGGDCEDYAIAKYVALRSLGVPEDRLRIAIVQDTYKNIPHAVLVVYTESGAYILDNQNEKLISAEEGSRYRPIYSINRQGWWLHTAPDRTQMASAR